ncbi:xanthine dehydrogenase family protein molybdopterin-binding subunit [Nocardioides daejeonensis]|uniref:xanthine dehydrogenase family protein molybdopterin-binding subunit n=1 Tax=Nocardioides daejeonensis TaxID=1046556 RepID=UPI000D745975|nr:xanthine dehydrogenase family protein molybdopterin-binding subunit [Nocardioides daejeonensis]
MTDQAEPTTWVGRSLPRFEDPAILRGWGTYVADIAAHDHGCLYAVFVRSPLASGVLREVSAPAHVRMITAADLAEVHPIAPALTRPDYVTVETPILAHDVVRFVGEPVALVLGDTPAEAEDAAELVSVEIDPLPPVLDASAAVLPDSPLVHPADFPGDPNTVVDGRITTGGYDEVSRGAAHTVEIEVSCSRQSAMPMEARASHAAYDRGSGRVTLSTTTQMPHVVRTGIADCLGIPEDDLRVIAPDVGGGFGAKMALAREDVALVHTARRLRRNLAWVETREENFLASWHSREQRYRVTGSFTEAGELVALGADIVADVGAYSCYPVTYGVEPLMAMAELPGPYRVAEYAVRARAVLSNKCPIAPYRGVSRPVQTLAMERLMDVAALQLGIDRLELRELNLVRDYPHRGPSGLIIDESSHLEALARAAELMDVEEFRERQRAALAQGRYLGQGFSCFAERTGYGTPAFAARSMVITPGYEQVQLAFDPSGGLVLRIGASPHGQGLRTSLAQVVADELGVDPGVVRVVHSDTDQTPYGWGSFGSRAMVIAGGATRRAGADLRDKVTRIAADMMECDPADVELAEGRATVRGTDRSVSIPDITRRAFHSSHLLAEDDVPGLDTTAFYNPGGTFSNAVHAAEVEVEASSGHVRITRFLVVEDAGVLVNPQIVEGQVRGGIAQGIANALYEELIYDDAGNLVTTSLMDFLPPTMQEVPQIEIHHLHSHSDQTITGAKGVGEGGTIGAPGAVLNAVSDALSPLGVGFTHMPVTPAMVRTAIRSATETTHSSTTSGGTR